MGVGKDGEDREREPQTRPDYKAHALNKYKMMKTSIVLVPNKETSDSKPIRTTVRLGEVGPGSHSLPGMCFSASWTGFLEAYLEGRGISQDTRLSCSQRGAGPCRS